MGSIHSPLLGWTTRMINLTYRSPKTAVRQSPIHGQGLFATAAIAWGEIVAVKGGYILTSTQWAPLAQELGAADIQITEDLFIAPVHHDHREGSMVYTNHSCEPNSALQGEIVFVAIAACHGLAYLNWEMSLLAAIERCGYVPCHNVLWN